MYLSLMLSFRNSPPHLESIKGRSSLVDEASKKCCIFFCGCIPCCLFNQAVRVGSSSETCSKTLQKSSAHDHNRVIAEVLVVGCKVVVFAYIRPWLQRNPNCAQSNTVNGMVVMRRGLAIIVNDIGPRRTAITFPASWSWPGESRQDQVWPSEAVHPQACLRFSRTVPVPQACLVSHVFKMSRTASCSLRSVNFSPAMTIAIAA